MENRDLRNRQKELLELLDKSGAKLYALLTRLTLREDIAEELMQELFIKLSNSRGPRKIVNWEAYARKAAINLAFDFQRKQKRTALCLDNTVPDSNDHSPLGKLIQSEELQETLNAISKLNKTSREVLVMRYIQQESYETIAEQLGKPSHQVRALCSRAINNLRGMLKPGRRKVIEKETHNVET
jgi:RNA polymerase sigma-70 factor (ECF subfamily)